MEWLIGWNDLGGWVGFGWVWGGFGEVLPRCTREDEGGTGRFAWRVTRLTFGLPHPLLNQEKAPASYSKLSWQIDPAVLKYSSCQIWEPTSKTQIPLVWPSASVFCVRVKVLAWVVSFRFDGLQSLITKTGLTRKEELDYQILPVTNDIKCNQSVLTQFNPMAMATSAPFHFQLAVSYTSWPLEFSTLPSRWGKVSSIKWRLCVTAHSEQRHAELSVGIYHGPVALQGWCLHLQSPWGNVPGPTWPAPHAPRLAK